MIWNNLRASGIDLTKRTCITCKQKKGRSFFPAHKKYEKSRICFECLGEIKCRTCGKIKSYKEFKIKHKGARKSKLECWDCYIEQHNFKRKKLYQKNKKLGLLRKTNRSTLSTASILWTKVSSKRSRVKDSFRSREVNITAEEFQVWFDKNYNEQCYYCGVTIEQYRSSSFLKKIRPNIKNFGVDRKNTHEGYNINNIVICCNLCNSVKGSFFDDEEFKAIGKKYIRKLYD